MAAKDPKINTSVFLAPVGLERMDKLAAEHRVTRSDVIRAGLTVAARHADEWRDTIEEQR